MEKQITQFEVNDAVLAVLSQVVINSKRLTPERRLKFYAGLSTDAKAIIVDSEAQKKLVTQLQREKKRPFSESLVSEFRSGVRNLLLAA